MSYIDKFYRVYSPKVTQGRSASTSNSLKLHNEAWDALNHKISNVKKGQKLDDVAIVGQTLTKEGDKYVQGSDKYELMEAKNNKWLGKRLRIGDISDAIELTDVPTLGQTVTKKDNFFMHGKEKLEFMESKNNKWNAKKRKIEKVLPGTSDGEAVEFSQIPIQDQTKWDFKDKIISNVKSGKHSSDVMVKWQVISLDNNKFDGKGKKISNVIPGTEPGEVVVTEQLIKKVKDSVFHLNGENITLLQLFDDCCWDGCNKILSQIKPGQQQSDAATVSQLATIKDGSLHLITGKYDIILPTADGEWDARDGKIKNVTEGTEPNDICLIKQAVVYDKNSKKFKYDNKEFNLMDKNEFPNILLASQGGFKTLGGSDFTPKQTKLNNKILVADPKSPSGIRTMDGTDFYVNLANKNLLVADESALSGMKKLDGSVYTPKNGVYVKLIRPLNKSWLVDAYGNDLNNRMTI